jgi:putative NIF3 family GTP cyclohydrolase 1 type 2
MKLEKLYKKAITIGIENDFRDKKEIQKLLEEEKGKFDGLSEEEKEFYDKDRIFNPFSDTRILYGDPNSEVNQVIVGIDMEIGEILLTHTLNKENKKDIDLIISHHPEGLALAQLHDVMKLQADILSHYGISISVAEQLLEKRISEVERGILPVNHNRAVDAAKILNIPMMCIHTPSDNCVTHYLKGLFEKEKPYNLKELMELLKKMPEYKKSSRLQSPPKIINGSENNRCGKIYVDMTGGTGGSEDIFDKITNSGISTLVGMHIGENHLKKAKQANLNVVIAGHISSDNLGLNLLFDEIEKEDRLNFIGISGFERFRRI